VGMVGMVGMVWAHGHSYIKTRQEIQEEVVNIHISMHIRWL
jgi:ABC-type uncharacterized transport system substrate-binding protein